MPIVKAIAGLGLSVIPTAAWASPPVPGPEAGIGLAAMVLIGAGYVAIKKRIDRNS